MTKVSDYAEGFVPSKSKTDNFKVTDYTEGCLRPGDGD
jgi:hypothetical protein